MDPAESVLSKRSSKRNTAQFHEARCIRCRVVANARALASSLLDAADVGRPLTRANLLALLEQAGLTTERAELDGSARAIVTPGQVMAGASPDDPDEDPWILAHSIAHRIYDLRNGVHVCVDADTHAETRADRFAGFLLIGSPPGRHGATLDDLAAKSGISVERIKRWSELVRCPDALPAPGCDVAPLPLRHSNT